ANVLVAGPPMTGKYELMLSLIAQHATGAIVISAKNQASRLSDDLRAIDDGFDENRIGVIDCVSHHEGLEDPTETDRVKYAESPENLTRIGVKFTELYETFHEDEALAGPTAVGIHSLSQLLMHSNVKQVYQFMQVLSGHIRTAGWMGVAVVDGSVLDEKEFQTLQHHFDGIVRTRENADGRREFRVQGLDPQASDWTVF
ncbi:MAG: hypothetical protein R3324_14125, partial [Halobacteriales archaeon]|nr:hypothetical protein [Halobacteriales archaeon]